VYGEIAYYLANQSELEKYLESQDPKWEEFRKTADSLPAGLDERLEGIRR